MKHIKVDSCKNCPYVWNRAQNRICIFTCHHPLVALGKHQQDFTNGDTIQSFCPLESLPEWVITEEHLPEDNSEVIGYWPNGERTQVRFENGRWCDPNDNHQTWKAPSHWQPLPAPPKEDEG